MKLKLCNVHKLTLANEGESRKPIHIPFGTWDYDDRITQTLDREHAQAIANELQTQIAAGEPGIPVYQGHPDVPEYAGKYPDKGALGWVKKILVNEDGMDLEVEWDRDPGKGFGWFSPYWTGDNPTVGSDGKKNVVIDGLTSIGLVNNPNIREFRLANEMPVMGGTGNGERETEFVMPAHLLALAKRFDERRAMANVVDANGMGHSDENGQFDGSGNGNGGGGAAKPSNSPRFGTKAYQREEDERRSRIDKLAGDAEADLERTKARIAADRENRAKEREARRAAMEARIAEIRKKTASLKEFNDRTEARLKTATGTERAAIRKEMSDRLKSETGGKGATF